MTLDEFENANDAELRAQANRCFETAATAGGLDKPHLYQEAQFFMSEIERRKQGKANRLSFWLEIAVIVLILGELVIGFYEGSEQARILSDLQKSFASTAATLSSLQSTSEAMNAAIQSQTGHLSEVAISIGYSTAEKRLYVANTGKLDVQLIWYQFDGVRGHTFRPGITLVHGTSWNVERDSTYARFEARSEEGKTTLLPFRVVVKNQRGAEFEAESTLSFMRVNAEVHVEPTVTSLSPVPGNLFK